MFELVDRAAANGSTPNRSTQLEVASALCLAIGWAGVLLRCYVRGYYIRSFALDDWLMVLSLLLYSICATLCIRMGQLGLGRHTHGLHKDKVVEAFKYVYVGELFYNASSISTKIAFAFFYLRMLSEPWVFYLRINTEPWARRLLRSIIIFTACFGVVYGLVLVIQCIPIDFTWTRFADDGAKGKCVSHGLIEAGTYAHSAINASIDWTLGLIPIPLIWKTQMHWRAKLSVFFVLSIGIIASISTIIRFFYVDRLILIGDVTWNFEPLVLWSVIEPGIALFAGGLAVSKPLINAACARRRGDDNFNHPVLVIQMEVEEKISEHRESDSRGNRPGSSTMVQST